MENDLLTSPVTSPHASERKALVLRLTLLAPDIAILEDRSKRASPTFKARRREFVTVLGLAGWHPFETTKSSLRLGSIGHLIRISMARNAKQINAPVGTEVFSLEGEELESNILQLCPPSKCLNSEAFRMAIMPRGAFSEGAGRGGTSA